MTDDTTKHCVRCMLANKRRRTKTSWVAAAWNKLDIVGLNVLDDISVFREWTMMGQGNEQLVFPVLKTTASLCVVDCPPIARQIDAGLVAMARPPPSLNNILYPGFHHAILGAGSILSPFS